MTVNPSRPIPPEFAQALDRAALPYVDSDLPRIAVAPAPFTYPLATTWVQSHGELLMLADADGQWMLFFFGANNAVTSEKFYGTTDRQVAAGWMREWLDRQGLIRPEDME